MTTTRDILELVADTFDPPRPVWDQDPVAWITHRLRGETVARQRLIARALVEHRRVCVPAAHGVGKTALAARIMGWWVEQYPRGARIVTTAPTWDQVAGVLWQELRTVADLAEATGEPLPGVIGADCVWRVNGREIARGRKPADTRPAGLQGIHAEHLLAIVDEADGVAGSIIAAMMSLATSDGGAMLLIGNPLDPDSMFAELCRGADHGEDGTTPALSTAGWYVIPWPLHLSPRFDGEPVSPRLAAMLTGPAWLESFEKLYPPGSPAHEGRVMARWPQTALDGVMPGSWLAECMALDRHGTRPSASRTPVELGVDPAFSNGGDMSVIRERRGPLAGRVWRYQTPADDLAALIVDAIRETGATRVKIDTTGGAQFLASQLRAAAARGDHRAEIVPVSFGAGANEPDAFTNVRAELWWMGRVLSRDKAWILTEDETTGEGVDRRTLDDLKSARYSTDAAGRIKIEAKAEIKKRLGRSPDDADALLLAFYEGTSDPWSNAATTTQASYG